MEEDYSFISFVSVLLLRPHAPRTRHCSDFMILERSGLALRQNRAFGRGDDTGRKLGRNGSPFLDDGVTQEHGNDILMMIKQAIAIDVTQVPDKAQLIFAETRFHENISHLIGRQETTLRPQCFKTAQETVGRVLQSPVFGSTNQMFNTTQKRNRKTCRRYLPVVVLISLIKTKGVAFIVVVATLSKFTIHSGEWNVGCGDASR